MENEFAELNVIAARLREESEQRKRTLVERLAKRFAILMAGNDHTSEQAQRAAQEAVAAFALIEDVPIPILDSIKLETPLGEGYSVKPENLLLNPSGFLELIGSGWLMFKSEWGDQLTFVVASLIFLADLVRHVRVPLSRQDAAVIWTMWQRRRLNNEVEDDGLLEATNKTLQDYGDSLMSEAEYQACITRLLQIKAIERTGTHSEKWHIRESVSVSYRY